MRRHRHSPKPLSSPHPPLTSPSPPYPRSLDALDSDTTEARAASILHGLGFTGDMQKMKTREFSGGWRMRIALARALFIDPTCLLLVRAGGAGVSAASEGRQGRMGGRGSPILCPWDPDPAYDRILLRLGPGLSLAGR